MGTYIVSGVKLTKDGAGRVTSTTGAHLSVVFEGDDNGFAFSYATPVRTSGLTTVNLTAINTYFSIAGQSLDDGFKIALGSTLWQGHRIELMQVTDTSTGEIYCFQLQGGRTSTPIDTAAEWASLLTTSKVFGASGYQAGAVILPGQFVNDSFTDADKLTLTSGDDNVYLSGGRDTVFGGDGNDVIATCSGYDRLFGGAGNDTLFLDSSVAWTAKNFLEGNTLFGGDGTDTLKFGMSGLTTKTTVSVDMKLGTAILSGLGHTATTFSSVENLRVSGADPALHAVIITGSDGANRIDLSGAVFSAVTINAGMGNDTILGVSGDTTIDGGSGNDRIEVQGGELHVLGGTGNDEVINFGLGYTSADGGTGNDLLQGGAGNDKLFGGLGDDSLLGTTGNDGLFGGDGDDSLDGGAGKDSLFGGKGGDYILGGDGNDMLYGSDGEDTLYGVSGQDTVFGGNGDDFIFGGAGNLVDLFGGAGDDAITAGGQTSRAPDSPEPARGEAVFGDKGNDTLTGNWGQDTLDGGLGYDLMQGYVFEDGQKVGDGQRDVFILSGPVRHGPNGISDTVTYFEPGVDKLDLSALGVAIRLTTGDFVRNRLAQMHYDSSTGLLEVDLDGKGKVAWIAEVFTIGHAELTNADFIF